MRYSQVDLYKHINPSISLERYKAYLDMGVGLSTVAYRNAMYLRKHYALLHDKKDLPLEKTLTINACINNYVFYLGSRATPQDKQNALSALDELKKILRNI